MTRDYQAETAASITALAKRIMDTNMCKEIMLIEKEIMLSMNFKFSTQSKYKFSRANWHVADFDTQYYFEVEEWCKEQFGPHPKYPDAWSRWVHTYEDQIHFRDEKDYNWFVLRWGA